MRKAILWAAILVPFSFVSAQAAEADAALGKRQAGVCLACHTFNVGEKAKVGPNLHGIVGRKAAGADGFAYSDSMKKAGIIWDEEKLDKYLTKPQEFIPGNKMAFAGLPRPESRANVIAYLKDISK